MQSSKDLTRLDFLKRSGLITAGLTLLPHSLSAAASSSAETTPVSIRELAGYQIVVPDHTTALEQQAAERLQHYVSQLAPGELVLNKEADYRRGPAFFL